ncbi:mitochondrial outer membrane protein [Stagonosporopsis vannaccii]|nr:mitochondrial outer membrane protein [Stagonosporopsis vannaccii]
MRGPKIVFNEPCEGCRTGSLGLQISSGRTQVDSRRRHSEIDSRQLAHLANSSSSVLLGPRPVTPERAAKRIGNPPRVARLPPGIIRLPVPSVPVSQYRDTDSPPTYRVGSKSPDGTERFQPSQSAANSCRTKLTKESRSPKLHYIHGLPDSEEFPFIHKHEIPQHAIALRAGSTSPLTDRTRFPRDRTDADKLLDYSKTVQYGGRRPFSRVDTVAIAQPQVTTVVVNETDGVDRAAMGLRVSSLDTALAGTSVYRKRSPQQDNAAASSHALADTSYSSTTNGSQDTGSTRLGDIRLELRGGNTTSDPSPRLRGGIGHEGPSRNTLSFKFKRWLLTCHGPCPDDFDTDSEAELPPPRVVSPGRVARTREKMNGRAPLPAHLCKGSQARSAAGENRPGTKGLPSLSTFTATISGTPKRTKSSRFSALSLPTLFRRRPDSQLDSPINQPASLSHSQFLNPPFPHLRGGADTPGRVPTTLFWLAGGTGRKPITFGGWKQSRPKRRMGGLSGMAVFGGQDYKVEASIVGEGEISCSASVKIAVGNTLGAMEAHGSASGSRVGTVSNPWSSSSAPVASEPVEEGSADALGSPSDEDENGIPLCSGALPVEAVADEQTAKSVGTTPADTGGAQVPVPGDSEKDNYVLFFPRNTAAFKDDVDVGRLKKIKNGRCRREGSPPSSITDFCDSNTDSANLGWTMMSQDQENAEVPQRRRQQQNASRSIFNVPAPIKQLFDRFPLVTYSTNDLPQRAPRQRDAHVLHIFTTNEGALKGSPSYNPACLKWQAYLKFSNIEHQLAASSNHASPSGALPFLLPAQPDTTKHVQPVPSGKLQRWTMNNSETAVEEPGDLRYEAYLSLLDHRIRRAWLYSIYLSANFTSIAEPLYILPTSSNPFVRLTIARELRLAAEKELLKFSAIVSAETLYNQAEEAFTALDSLLGDDAWFFGAEGPGLFDASVFAYTHLLLDDQLGKGWLDTRLRDTLMSRQRLVAHRNKILGGFFPGSP